MLTINENIAIPLKEFEFKFSRSPGPGGQNVNKLNTKVTLKWAVQRSPNISGELKQKLIQKFPNRFNKQDIFFITSHRYRDQARNISDCLVKLKKLILLANQP
ncbi:MAG: peptide chain release factor-like protein, partial [Planctomycetota bacterium]